MAAKGTKGNVATNANASDRAVRESLQNDLGPLEAVSAGLADRATDYVLTGDHEPALDEIAQAQQQTKGYGSQQGLLHSGNNHLHHAGKSFLTQHGPHELSALVRFGKVLAASQAAWRLGFRSAIAQRSDIRWLAHLLLEHDEPLRYDSAEKAADKNPHLRQAETLVALLAEAGSEASTLFELLYSQSGRWGSHGIVAIRRELVGLDSVVGGLWKSALDAFSKIDPQGRISFVVDLSRLGLALRKPQSELIWQEACSSSKTMATAARSVLSALPSNEAIALAKATFEGGDATARRGAAEALAQIAAGEARETLLAQAKKETSKPLSEALKAIAAQLDTVNKAKVAVVTDVHACVPAGSTVLRTIDGRETVVPPAPPLPPDTPLPAEALEPLRRAIPAYNAAVRDQNASSAAHYKAQGWTGKPHQIPEIDAETAVPQLLSLLNGTGATSHAFSSVLRSMPWVPKEVPIAIEQVLSHSAVSLWHLARLVNPGTTGWRSVVGIALQPYEGVGEKLFNVKCMDGMDLRVVAGIGAAIGLPQDRYVRQQLLPYGFSRASLPVDEVPSLRFHVLEQLHVVEEALGMRPRTGTQDLDPVRALEILQELDLVPEHYLMPLLNLAIGPRKTLHKPARALLKNASSLEPAIVVRLADAKKEIRTAAATWLGERGHSSAVAAVEKAMKKEKSEEGRAAMLSALSRLGADMSEYLSEKSLRSEASKGLEKTPWKALEWFPFDQLPPLKWGAGKKVDPIIVKWWIVLADKLKSPSGNALFDFYLDRLVPDDAAALGQFILTTFVARDTVSPSEEEAQAAGKAFADQQQQWWQQFQARNPQAAAQLPAFSYQQAFQAGRLSKLAQHIYSAAEHRGILGLTSRAPGADAAALARRYLKENGSKTSQARSLLAALSANPAPAAIQVVLAAANRLKQKSVQAYASELVQSIADLRGWTRDELADRTIPTGGFDDGGTLDLPCGEGRLFKAVYHGEGRVELLNPAGKPAKALPDPRGDNAAEKEQVAASKKALSAARKEVKQVEKMQTERLYEAMCVERTWPAQVWQDNLNQHPIVGRLCRRLLWLGLDAEGKKIASFRPLDDGTLTGRDDDSIALKSLTSIKLAHQALVGEKDAAVWSTHLRDYDVRPLFQQLGRSLLKPPSELANATEIDDRKGWMTDNFKLASAAGKLGYERGQAEDGGHVSSYVKRFSGVGLSAVIQFTGHYIAESKQVPCALVSLSFFPVAQGHGFGRAIVLGKVAPVLLSEAWSDLHVIASAGSGFDKDWQQKAGY